MKLRFDYQAQAFEGQIQAKGRYGKDEQVDPVSLENKKQDKTGRSDAGQTHKADNYFKPALRLYASNLRKTGANRVRMLWASSEFQNKEVPHPEKRFCARYA